MEEVVELLRKVTEAEPIEFGQGFAIYDANAIGVAEKLAFKLGLVHVTHVLVATRPGWLYLQLMDALGNKSAALHIWEKGCVLEYTSYAEEKIKGVLPPEAEEVVLTIIRKLSYP